MSQWSTEGLEVLVNDATTLRVRDATPLLPGQPPRYLRVRVTAAL